MYFVFKFEVYIKIIMRKYTKSDNIKLKILKYLSNQKKLVSLYEIEKATKTNYNSILPNCNFLSDINFIKLKKLK